MEELLMQMISTNPTYAIAYKIATNDKAKEGLNLMQAQMETKRAAGNRVLVNGQFTIVDVEKGKPVLRIEVFDAKPGPFGGRTAEKFYIPLY